MASSDESLEWNDLVDIEDNLIQQGYNDGVTYGELLGIDEGLAIGKQRGFELGEELGSIYGTVALWRLLFETPSAPKVSSRTKLVSQKLISLVPAFPACPTDPNYDDKLGEIRSSFKQLNSLVKCPKPQIHHESPLNF